MSLAFADLPCYRRDPHGSVGRVPDNGKDITNFNCPGDNSGIYNCCVSGDTCVGSSICLFTHSQENGSGFYMAGCTDESFQNPLCTNHCSRLMRRRPADSIQCLWHMLIISNGLQPIKSFRISHSTSPPAYGLVAEMIRTAITPRTKLL